MLLTVSLRDTVLGVSAAHLSLESESRSEPCSSLPPDLVSVLTTPPAKRPYSAEIAAVWVVVSCTASSIQSALGVLRMLSWTTTPLTR